MQKQKTVKKYLSPSTNTAIKTEKTEHKFDISLNPVIQSSSPRLNNYFTSSTTPKIRIEDEDFASVTNRINTEIDSISVHYSKESSSSSPSKVELLFQKNGYYHKLRDNKKLM